MAVNTEYVAFVVYILIGWILVIAIGSLSIVYNDTYSEDFANIEFETSSTLHEIRNEWQKAPYVDLEVVINE